MLQHFFSLDIKKTPVTSTPGSDELQENQPTAKEAAALYSLPQGAPAKSQKPS